MDPEVVESQARLDQIVRAGHGYIYNDTWWVLHLPGCGQIKAMKPELTTPEYDFAHGEPYPEGRNRGVTAFFDCSYEEAAEWLGRYREGWRTCRREDCFQTVSPGTR